MIKGPPRPSNYTSPLESEQEEKNEMNGSTPAALNVKRSIDRQRKEQRAVTSILSGVGLGLLLIIVSCATLSAFGGYVLWKQIQQQSVTVAQMEQKINKDLADLQARDAELASGLESAGAQLAKQLSTASPDDVGNIQPNLSRILGPGSVFALDRGEHKRRRRLLTPPFHGKSIKNYERIFEEETLRESANWPVGQEFATLEPMMLDL